MAKKLLTLSFFLFLSVALVYGLYVKSQKALDQRSGFSRFIKTGILTSSHQHSLEFNSYYVCGADSKNIYLGNVTSNAKLNTISYDFSQITDQILTYEYCPVAWGALKLNVDSPMIYANELLSPTFLRKEINTESQVHLIHPKGGRIFSVKNISPTSYVAVVRNPKTSKNDLLKFNMNDQVGALNFNDSGDGIFSRDGQILNVGDKLVYVFYYRNEFLISDTSLKNHQSFKTIDTIATNNLQIGTVHSTGMSSLVKPPVIVNKRACINNNTLFIESIRFADNETRSTDRTIIDRYRLTDGKYIGSFYIPLPAKKITSIYTTNDKLIATVDRSLYWFDLKATDDHFQ